MTSLDRGWDLLDEGKIAEAQAVAEGVLEQSPDEPDAILLMAVCCRREGRPEEALTLLARLSEQDPDWPIPALWSAEILSEELGEPEEALVQASRALDLADEEDEFLDAVMLKAGLEIELGKSKAAKRTLSELPPAGQVRLPPDLECDIAHLFLEAGDVDEAQKRFSRLVNEKAMAAHAYYGIGLCAEQLENEDSKKQAWLRVHELDTAMDIEGPRLTEEEMAEVAEAALTELPTRARELLANVPILISDLPHKDEVERGLDPRLLGLFEGAGHGEESHLGGSPHLTRILLFRKNLERIAIDADDLREQVRITLIHETGHFFGLDEDDLAKLGLD